MKPPLDRARVDALLAKLQECESEAHAIGFHLTGHAINAAKNQTGWELAGWMDAASKAAKS